MVGQNLRSIEKIAGIRRILMTILNETDLIIISLQKNDVSFVGSES
jgi:hypothetical protein